MLSENCRCHSGQRQNQCFGLGFKHYMKQVSRNPQNGYRHAVVPPDVESWTRAEGCMGKRKFMKIIIIKNNSNERERERARERERERKSVFS